MRHHNVHKPWAQWSEDQTLHVACAYSNPFRWQTRRHLMNDFRHHMKHTPNVDLYVGELAYGDRPFEVTERHNTRDLQFRTTSELFHKENILCETIRHFPHDWKYGAYCDGDFTFTRHDWALEAIHKLQHHDFVQLFSTYSDISAKRHGGCQPTRMNKSFAATYLDNNCCVPGNINNGGWGHKYDCPWVPVGATGGAWAFTRRAYDLVGGLLESCILGHADWFMAFGLVSEPVRGMHDHKYHPNYSDAIHSWQRKAAELKRNIGVVDQYAIHHFHGRKTARGYNTRDMILVKHQFDHVSDLRKNWQGIYELTGNKPGLRDDMRRYFLVRDEDNPND